MNIQDFEAEISKVLNVDVRVNDTGQIKRFSTNGKRGDLAGWLVFFDTAGAFGDWRTGLTRAWSAERPSANPAERQAIRRKIQQAIQAGIKERAHKHQQARQEAARIWSTSLTPTQHTYLQNKAVKAHGIRQYGRFLIVPMVDEAGGPWSLQRIDPAGEKRFMPGGRMKGRFHLIEGGGRVGIAEGYATAATLFEQTGDTMLVAFNAGNLKDVAVTARAMYPAAHLTIWADNDQFTDGNPGKTKAYDAATACGANAVKIPDFSGYDLTSKPTDWNDLYLLEQRNG